MVTERYRAVTERVWGGGTRNISELLASYSTTFTYGEKYDGLKAGRNVNSA